MAALSDCISVGFNFARALASAICTFLSASCWEAKSFSLCLARCSYHCKSLAILLSLASLTNLACCFNSVSYWEVKSCLFFSFAFCVSRISRKFFFSALSLSVPNLNSSAFTSRSLLERSSSPLKCSCRFFSSSFLCASASAFLAFETLARAVNLAVVEVSCIFKTSCK